jgi:hypothetical protein
VPHDEQVEVRLTEGGAPEDVVVVKARGRP